MGGVLCSEVGACRPLPPRRPAYEAARWPRLLKTRPGKVGEGQLHLSQALGKAVWSPAVPQFPSFVCPRRYLSSQQVITESP